MRCWEFIGTIALVPDAGSPWRYRPVALAMTAVREFANSTLFKGLALEGLQRFGRICLPPRVFDPGIDLHHFLHCGTGIGQIAELHEGNR